MWAGASRSFNYNLAPHHDIFVVAPASSFHHHHQNDAVLSDPNNGNANPTTALGVGVNVIPLLTATPCLVDGEGIMGNNNNGRNRIQLWQDHESQQQYLKKHGQGVEENGNLVEGGGISGSLTNSGGATCQDCGNQAKKDCSHRRCRTCCKSRGFDCVTHVKSTWVPAARRRERQLMGSVVAAGSSGSTSGAKKPRLVASHAQTTSHTSTSNNTTPPRSFDTSSSHQDGGLRETLPCQVRAPAVFKCVRVTSVDEREDEYAYQAVVKIGGHVFKGFLYDQGVEEDRDGYPNISELHLGGGSGNVASGSGRNGVVSSSSPMMDPSNVYAASGGGLLGGSSNYGNPIN